MLKTKDKPHPKRSVDALIAKYRPKTTRSALGPACPLNGLGPEAVDLARGLRERQVTLDEIARILMEEFSPATLTANAISRHLRGRDRCARG